MRKYQAWVAALLVLGLMATAAPAQAQSGPVSDPSGDVSAPGLDITAVTFTNRDQVFGTALTFVADTTSTVIVAIRMRHGHLVRVISQHPAQGADTTFLIDNLGRTLPCGGLSSSWNRAAATLSLQLPANCIQRGDYGAVRAWALTENSESGRDVDYAPEDAGGDIQFTGWLPRG